MKTMTLKTNRLGRFIGPAALALGLMVGSSGFGQTIVQTRRFDEFAPTSSFLATPPFTYTPGTIAFEFDKIDTAFGTSISSSDIVSVTVSVSLSKVGGDWSVTNNTSSSIDFDVTELFTAWVSDDSGVTLSSSATGYPVDPDDFILNTSYEFNGTVTGNEGNVTDNFGAAGPGVFSDNISTDFFDEYEGSGTFEIVLDAFRSASISGGSLSTSTDPSFLEGVVTVTYVVIPEPGTIALFAIALGSAGAMAFLRRRKRS